MIKRWLNICASPNKADKTPKVATEIFKGVLYERFVVERFIKGEEYGFLGAVNDGKLIPILTRKKIFKGDIYRGELNIAEPHIASFNELLQKVVYKLGLQNCLLDADFIITADKKPFLIELAPRASGHHLSGEFCRLATGIDPMKEFIKMALNKPFSFAPKWFKPLQIRRNGAKYEIKE